MTKKIDAPKFKPVKIAGFRQIPLAATEEECRAMLEQDRDRMKAEIQAAYADRLEVLKNHVGLHGLNLGPGLFLLLMKVAEHYVRGFKIEVGAKPAKTGPRKIAERFAIVTSVELCAARDGVSIKEAIKRVSDTPGKHRSADSLSTRYYTALREVTAHPNGDALLTLWRKLLPMDASKEMADLFLRFEIECLDAKAATKVAPPKLH